MADENPRHIVLLTETSNDITEDGQVIERKIYLGDAESYAAGRAAGLADREVEIEKLRATLTSIRAWDMLNPAAGAPEPLADGPWLRGLLSAALASADAGGDGRVG